MHFRIFRMIVTSGFLTSLECAKFVLCRSGPRWGAYSAHSDPLSGLRGPISKGKGRWGEGRGWKKREVWLDWLSRNKTITCLNRYSPAFTVKPLQSLVLSSPHLLLETHWVTLFPSHINSLQLLLYDVNPILSWSYGLSLCRIHLLACTLFY